MAERVYEGMYLFDANRYSRDSSTVTSRLNEMIEKCGGEVLVGRLWAEQKLAYPINGQRKGAYWLTYFKMEGARLKELTRAAQLNKDVMRELVLAVEPRLVDALVSHAQSGGKPAEAPKETKAAAPPTKPATAAPDDAAKPAEVASATATATLDEEKPSEEATKDESAE